VFLSDVLSGGDHAGTEFIFSLLNDVPQHRLVLIMVELADECKIAEDEIEKAGGRSLKRQHDDRRLPGDRGPFLFT